MFSSRITRFIAQPITQVGHTRLEGQLMNPSEKDPGRRALSMSAPWSLVPQQALAWGCQDAFCPNSLSSLRLEQPLTHVARGVSQPSRHCQPLLRVCSGYTKEPSHIGSVLLISLESVQTFPNKFYLCHTACL